MRYQIKSSAIIHETLDDEVIIANLDSGVYYSLREAGVQLWQLLVAGFTLDEISTLCFDKWGEDVTSSFEEIVSKLLADNLVSKTDQTASPLLPDMTWPSSYSPAIFANYEEMKDLLILDPIHEVDEIGWPCQQK